MAMVILGDLLTFDGAELACAPDPRNYGSGAGKPSSIAQSFIVTRERPTEERLGMWSEHQFAGASGAGEWFVRIKWYELANRT